MVCGLAGCEVHNGTYIAVTGEPAGITFDEVEFFLGKDGAGVDKRLHTPGRPFVAQVADEPVERHRMIKRLFTASDVQPTAETRSLTYYLTIEADGPSKYASYGLIVASRGGTPVGVAEVENFAVRDDGAYVYEVELAPVDENFERWGTLDVPGQSCARWTRPRGDRELASTYAVVRDGDFDCDDALARSECDDLNYCNPAVASPGGCQVRRASCIAASGCDIGSCSDGQGATTCEPETCLPEHFCAALDSCDEKGPVDDFLACALELPALHTEVQMPIRADGGLCSHTFVVPSPQGLGCREPQIEAPPGGAIDDWVFTVQQSITPEQCMFALDGPSPDAAPPPDSHLVISVATAHPERRTSFVIGFQRAAEVGCITAPVILPAPSSANPICP